MASSGSKTYKFTNWDSIVFSWEITNQSVENNTSTIAWKVQLVSGSSGKIESSVAKMCAVTINGVVSAGSSTINIGNNATKTLRSGTQVITHDANGTKTFDFNVNQELNITFSGTNLTYANFSGSGTLDPIPRLSTVTATSGILGQEQTLTVSRLSSSFTHTITYKCGSKTGTVCTKSSATSISFTPPLNLAEANTTGQTVNVTYTIATINGNVTLAGTKTATATYTMRAEDFAPDVSYTWSDPTGYKDYYGFPVITLSKFAISITATPQHGASITSYSTWANETTYKTASFTTGTLTNGLFASTIRITVKDSRGFSTEKGASFAVIQYTPPIISKLTVHRCNADGTENGLGEYVKASFDAAVHELENKNTATYKLSYKKSSDSTYTEATLSDYANEYTVTDGNYIFPAASEHAYDVLLAVTDNHNTTIVSTSASTAFTLIHFRADGTGVAFGKISEQPDLADFGLRARFSGGILNEVLEKYNDLDEVMIPNTYASVNKTSGFYSHCPVSSGTFVLEVMSAGAEGQLFQRLTTTYKDGAHQVYCRHYFQGAWGKWVLERSDTGWLNLVLPSGISCGSEMGYLKGRLKDGVLYIKGDVKGITANWQYFALLPTALCNGLASANRFTGLYNLSYLCGFNLNSSGRLYVSSNSAGTWDGTKDVHINVAICI